MSDIFNHALDAWESYGNEPGPNYNSTYTRRKMKSTSSGNPSVEVQVVFVYETEKAVLVGDGKENETWLPKSQIEEDWIDEQYEKGEEIEITIPEWLAIKTGLI